MAKLLIITRNSETYSHNRFLEAAHKKGISTKTLHSNNFSGLPEIEDTELVLTRDSGISYDDIDLILATHYQNNGIKVVNDPDFLRSMRAKDLQFLFFTKLSLPCIPTFVSRGPLFEDPFLSTDQFVVKTIRGNQGKGVFHVDGVEALFARMKEYYAKGDERFLIQPLLEFETEYRVLIYGDHFFGALEKKPKKDFKANAKNSHNSKVNLPNEVQALVEKIQKLIGPQFLGLDIAIGKEGPIIIEMNTTPGFEIFDEVHDSNIAGELLEKLL